MAPSREDKRADRYRAWRYGGIAETLCAVMLRLKGYHILERRFRVPIGEIDIVARRGGTLVFIEVKARTRNDAADVLTARQRRRIVRAAQAFIASRPRYADCALRFDLMVVRPGAWPDHFKDAWRPEP